MSAFVGMVDRPKALTGFFKLYRSAFNSSTLKAHACLAMHSPLWNLLLRYLKFVGHGNDTKIVGRGRKRQGRDPNVQLLSACWDLKTHRKLQKQDPLQVKFIKDLVLLIAKALVPISLCENPWFQRAFLRHTPSLNFPNRKQLRQLYIPQLRRECYQRHVKKLLDQVVAGWGTIDLYMSLPSGDIMSQQFHAIVKIPVMTLDKFGHWGESGEQKRVKMVFDLGCETFPVTSGAVMAPKVLKVWLRSEVDGKHLGTTYDGGANLQTLADVTDTVTSCKALGNRIPSRSECFMHFFGSSIGAATNAPADNDLAMLGLGKFKVKLAQQCFQKIVTYTKKSGTGARLWQHGKLTRGLWVHVT